MVNWLKVSGVLLMVLGILILLVGSMSNAIYIDDSEELPYEKGFGPPLWIFPLGIAMTALGAYLYYLGRRKEKKVV
ncbi:MAG TPA: hypothetical protein VGB78_01055 [Thermoplasmata archaeon]